MFVASFDVVAVGRAPTRAHEELRLALTLHRAQGETPEWNDALALTGLAFRTYAFTPDDNHAWRETSDHPEWDDVSLRVENYGMHESLGGHTGRWLRPYTGLAAQDAWELASSELQEGRAVLAFDVAGAALRVVGCTHRKGTDVRLDDAALEGERRTLALHYVPGQPPPESPFTTVWVMRPEAPPASESLARTLLRDVLAFAYRHASSQKEISFGDEVFVASGLRGWAIMADFLAHRADESAASLRHADAWLQDVAEARRGAADSMTAGRLPWDAVAEREALGAAALAWSECAAMTEEARALLAETGLAQRERLAQFVLAARQREEAAVHALGRALRAGG